MADNIKNVNFNVFINLRNIIFDTEGIYCRFCINTRPCYNQNTVDLQVACDHDTFLSICILDDGFTDKDIDDCNLLMVALGPG